MDMMTLDVDIDTAKQQLADYKAMADTERTREDERIRAGYRAVARGLPVISLSQTIAAGGYFDNGLPRIGIVHADTTTCWVYRENRRDRTDFVFTPAHAGFHQDVNRGALVNLNSTRVNVPREESHDNWRTQRGSSVVPSIPPSHRPRRNRLHLFHILWEVESWEILDPPHDPALLKWIGGDLWAVVATWDLSELERAVLSGRQS